jgi:hypothetical protein
LDKVVTKDEEDYLDEIQQLGCIVCKNNGIYSPAEIHHLIDGNRRKGHTDAIPLCVPHHRGGSDGVSDQRYISRHPYKKRFELAYGSEQALLEQTRELRDERFGN